MRKTKIVCTLGPSSTNEETMRKMLEAGMNVARLNFSHGTHEGHKETIEKFRRVRDELDIPAAVLLDTKGPEIRTGNFVNGEETLVDGQTFVLTTEAYEGTKDKVSVTYKDLPKEVKDTVLYGTKGEKYELAYDYSDRQTAMILDGGLLNYTKNIGK